MPGNTPRSPSDDATARRRAEITQELNRISDRMARNRDQGKEPAIPVFRRDGHRFTVIVEDFEDS